jgi:hypothetical protein
MRTNLRQNPLCQTPTNPSSKNSVLCTVIECHSNLQEKRPKTPWIALLFLILGCCSTAYTQLDQFAWRLSHIPGVVATPLTNPQFPGGYWQLMVNQPLDHAHPNAGTFAQRVFVGIQAADAPVVLDAEGYGADFAAKPDAQLELSATLNANQVVVEHRFFGKSQPNPLNYEFFTTQQAAADLHAVKTLLDSLLVGKWISTGTSKGGQAALAHRMAFPKDVNATVLYGTAVKKVQSISTGTLLKPLLETPCGQAVARFQADAFAHKDSLFPAFIAQVAADNLDFGDMELEVVFDYALLEFPYSFFQGGFSCEAIPTLPASSEQIVGFLTKVVPPKQYTTGNRKRWWPAFYMFYHELGYYEYDLAPFQRHLKQAQYPNAFFAPPNVEIAFDSRYLQDVRDFLDEPIAHSVYFIYGENDPWALQSVVVNNKYVVPQGNHASKIIDLPEELRDDLMRKLLRCLR